MPDRRDASAVRIGGQEFDHVVYDHEADVLYLSVGEPSEPARQESTPEGHLVRYDADDRVIGITIVNAKWLSDRRGEITVSMRVDANDLAPSLPDQESAEAAEAASRPCHRSSRGD